MHSVAHTADLLKFLARSRHIERAQQALILTAIADKLARVDTVLIHGEDERLARAVLSIVARDDLDQAAFGAWTDTILGPPPTGPPTPASLAAGQNRRNLLVSLHAVLSTDARKLATLDAARSMVLAALKKVM